MPGAIARDEFASLMAPLGPFETKPAVAVGVSGGRDSLSLAFLTREWAADRGGRVLALIVDHGLRPQSSAEVEATRALLARHDISSEVLAWSGRKPDSGIQAAARSARYRLLFEACRRHGILHLLLGHHADDQAETVAMRAARATGPDGLAGMAAVVEHRDARLLRPLLAVARMRLTATLMERGVRWIDDPSNADPRFERSRLRGRPPAKATHRPSAAADRAARDRSLADIALAILDLEPPDAVALDRAALEGLDQPQAARLLSRVVQALGRRDHPPRRDRLDRATARLLRPVDRGKSGKSQDFTLSECRLMLRRAPDDHRLRWIVRPENGRKGREQAGQPLVPAAFFACGTKAAPHLK